MTTGAVEASFSPGIGYGLTFNPTQWYAAGVDLYLSIDPGPGQRVSGAIMAKLIGGWFRVGLARDFVSAGKKCTRIPIGVGLDF